ncbi:folate-binding protein YgfZ [Williamsia sp. 1135]|nr:folate-binding protein YgfZ [Williamsia sp. 1135]
MQDRDVWIEDSTVDGHQDRFSHIGKSSEDARTIDNVTELLDSLRAIGAVGGPEKSLDEAVAWHFGDPFGEQRAAATSAVMIDRSHRGVITLTGPERLSWLNTISSQLVTDLSDGRSAENLSLDGNGRVEDHFLLTDLDGTTWIDTEGFRAEALAGFLTKMVFWAQVEVAARPDMAVLTLIGPETRTGAIAQLLEIPSTATVYDAGVLPGGGFWRVMPAVGEHAAVETIDLIVPVDQLTTWWSSLTAVGVRPSGTWTYEALRVAALRPRLGADTDERTIPHEVNWIGSASEFGAVHLNKGCYRGQETVARVHNLGKPPRQMLLLHLDGSADTRPVTGDPVIAGGRTVGRIGTVVEHYEYGPIALALIKRGVPADTALEAGGTSAAIDPASVPADDRVQAGRAAIERLRGK